MRWLQWGTVDFERGQGGVEVHARCLARELAALGVQAELSSDPAALSGKWDVIHTHGSMVNENLAHANKGALRLHTLHGVTLDRIKACGEWLWLGGYRAYLREAYSVKQADGVLSIHDRLSLYCRAKEDGKPTTVCGNAWDTPPEIVEPSPRALEILNKSSGRPLWLFVGRRDDTVKGADLFEQLLTRDPRLTSALNWAVIPGDGFERKSGIFPAGALDPNDIRFLLRQAEGIVLPSRYEGLPWVALEALAHGTCVVAHAIGGMVTIPAGALGLTLVPMSDFPLFSSAILSAPPATERTARQVRNRELLPKWSDVARRSLDLVLEIKRYS
jgi:glycosyltransferase involved in cell wall biosynthesis